MDTIKNYLDNMFLSLPVTEEVLKAKEELSQMMEDKYEELIAEGKSKNEAVGVVISEFGNLEEIAEELGIKTTVENADSRDILPLDMVKAYITGAHKRADYISAGVLLCICSVVPPIVLEFFNLDGVGAALMFVLIAVAVGFFIMAGAKPDEIKTIERGEFSLGIESAEYVANEKRRYLSTSKMMLSIGVALCILCVFPPILLDTAVGNAFTDALGGASLFCSVGLGVFLITNQANKMAGYDRLLKLNEEGSMGEKFVEEENRTSNTIIGTIISVYWYTVLCAFLIIGFISFHWFAALSIWFYALIVYIVLKVLDNQLKKMEA